MGYIVDTAASLGLNEIEYRRLSAVDYYYRMTRTQKTLQTKMGYTSTPKKATVLDTFYQRAIISVPSGVSARETAAESAKVIETLKNNDVRTYANAYTNNFYKVYRKNSTTAYEWVPSTYSTLQTVNSVLSVAVVLPSAAPIYDKTDQTKKQIGSISSGSKRRYFNETSNGYYKVDNGGKGVWVSHAYVSGFDDCDAYTKLDKAIADLPTQILRPAAIELLYLTDGEIRTRAMAAGGVGGSDASNKLAEAINDVKWMTTQVTNKNATYCPKGVPNYDAIKAYFDTVTTRTNKKPSITWWKRIYEISQDHTFEKIFDSYKVDPKEKSAKEQLDAAIKDLKAGKDLDQMISDAFGKDAKGKPVYSVDKVKSDVKSATASIYSEIFSEVTRRMITAGSSTTWDSIANAVGRRKEFVVGSHPYFRWRINTVVSDRISNGKYPDTVTIAIPDGIGRTTLPLQESANYTSKVLADLKNKTVCTYLGETKDGYYKVSASGKTGWVLVIYTTFTDGLKARFLDLAKNTDTKRALKDAYWIRNYKSDNDAVGYSCVLNDSYRNGNYTVLPKAATKLQEECATILTNFAHHILTWNKIDALLKKKTSYPDIAIALGLAKSTDTTARKNSAGEYVKLLYKYKY